VKVIIISFIAGFIPLESRLKCQTVALSLNIMRNVPSIAVFSL
jgi:hypothetical protein